LSHLYKEVGQTEKSDLYLAKAAELKSADTESRLTLARSHIQKGDLAQAEKFLLEVLKRDPQSREALTLLAQILEKQGRKQDLADVYKKILSLEPDNGTVVYNLGVLNYEMGNLEQGAAFLEKYAAAHPQDAEIHEILFDIYRKTKNDERALKEAQVLLDLKPKNMELYPYAFDHLSQKGDYQTLISIMEKGAKRNPDQVVLREYLVIAYLKTGKEDSAAAEMEQILRLQPKNVDVLLNLARLQEKRGQVAAAMEAYRRIIEISPENEEAREAYLRLRLQRVQDGGK